MNDIKTIFERPLPSERRGAFFNTFSYPTKISPESIAVYIAAATKPGETVLDTFGGSGSTGIAALLCEHPTDRMKALASELCLDPVWGPRNAIGYEIGTYGSFAAQTISSRLKAGEFKKAVVDFVGKEKDHLMHYYSAVDPDGKIGTIRYIIWSEVLLCPYCGGEISFFENGTKRNPVVFEKDLICPHCRKKAPVEDMKYQTEEYMDGLTGKLTMRKKRIPSRVYGTTDGKNWDRPATDEDLEKAAAIEQEMQGLDDAPKEIQWGELHRNGYHFGISYLHQFYTSRNYLVMRKLWDAADAYDEKVKDALRLLLLSYNASHCTMMTRVVAKKNATRPLTVWIVGTDVERGIAFRNWVWYNFPQYKPINRCLWRYKICGRLSLGMAKWIFNGKNGVHRNSLIKTVKCMMKHRFIFCCRMVSE